jgi:xanthine dehydrogenase accessory factor
MRDLLDTVDRWLEEGRRVAAGTVIEVWGSAPRLPGAKMMVSGDGAMAGSVSGGCVEGAVVEEAGRVLAGGGPRLLKFGVSDERAWAVGLTCGGEISVFVEELAAGTEGRRLLEALRRSLEARRRVVSAVVISGEGTGRRMLVWESGESLGDLGAPRLNQRASLFAESLLEGGGATRKSFSSPSGSLEVFFEAYLEPPELVVVGAVHVAIPLVQMASILGFRTVVVDPRSSFATRERFPEADELIAAWPQEALEGRLHRGTFLAVLSHDPKIDQPALEMGLRSAAPYLGALGSRKSHEKRKEALKEAGFAEQEIGRIHGPIGLDLGGRKAEEIALAILAQVVATRHGRKP